jgi:hypothetical protein
MLAKISKGGSLLVSPDFWQSQVFLDLWKHHCSALFSYSTLPMSVSSDGHLTRTPVIVNEDQYDLILITYIGSDLSSI